MADDRSALASALDLFVYVPLGVLARAREDAPALAERGRQIMATQGAMYRGVGEFAAKTVRQKAEQHAGGIYDLLSSVGLVERRDDDNDDGAGPEPAAPSGDHPAPAEGPEAAIASVEAVSEPDPQKVLPIADYDTLPAAQIVPLLAGLDRTERAAIAAYERAGRGRRTILGRLERLGETEADAE